MSTPFGQYFVEWHCKVHGLVFYKPLSLRCRRRKVLWEFKTWSFNHHAMSLMPPYSLQGSNRNWRWQCMFLFNLTSRKLFFFFWPLSVPSLMKLMTGNKNFRTRQRHLNLKPRKKRRIFFQKNNAFNNSWKTARTLRSVLLNIRRQEAKWKRRVQALWRK